MAAGDTSVVVPESTARVEGVHVEDPNAAADAVAAPEEADEAWKRPRLVLANVALTIVTVGLLISGPLAPELCFIGGALIALVLNYPNPGDQTRRINAHAPGAMLRGTTLLAAGVLLGVWEGTGMIEAMARSGAGLMPEAWAPALPLMTGLLGVPLSLIFGPDAYYFGVMPVLMGVGGEFGVEGSHIAQASVIGQETVGFPISPMTGAFHLLVGLAGVDIGRHIRATFGWLWSVSVIMLVAAILTGVVPVWA